MSASTPQPTPPPPSGSTSGGSDVPTVSTPSSPSLHDASRDGLFHRWTRGLGRWLYACTEWFRGPDTLDKALDALNEQLGLVPEPDESNLADREPATVARPSAEWARAIVYAPDMDGLADPGEVVWVPVQLEGERTPVRERAVVVVGRNRHILLGALISSREEHADQPEWVFVGNSSWEREPKPSWVRFDRILEVPESGIRRRGAVMPRKRFDIVAAKLRSNYGWS